MPADCRACAGRREAEIANGHICDKPSRAKDEEYARSIWGDDAVFHEECGDHKNVWHHRNYHDDFRWGLPLRLRLRWAARSFWRELRYGR